MMISSLKPKKESFHNKFDKIDFTMVHMWHALCHQPKWCTSHGHNDSGDRCKKTLSKLGTTIIALYHQTVSDQQHYWS